MSLMDPPVAILLQVNHLHACTHCTSHSFASFSTCTQAGHSLHTITASRVFPQPTLTTTFISNFTLTTLLPNLLMASMRPATSNATFSNPLESTTDQLNHLLQSPPFV